MALLEGPLYGDEARGRIKNTLVFIKRTANLKYEGEDPGERFIINHLKAFRQTSGVEREEWKETFKGACVKWNGLSGSEKDYYEGLAVGLETGFNAYLKKELGGGEEMAIFDGPVNVIVSGVQAVFSFINEVRTGFMATDMRMEAPEESFVTQGPTAGFSYQITG